MAEENIGPFRTISTVVTTRWTRIVSAYAPDGGKVAIKIFELGGSLAAERGTAREVRWRRRFESEAFLLGGIEHPNIVPVIAHGNTANGSPYFVMPFFEANLIGEIGGDIGSRPRVERLAPVRRPKPVSVRRSVSLLRQILRGVAALHALDIVHRDIKPGNVLLTRRRNGRARVADLGMAMVDGRTLDADGEKVGTVGYVAPEMEADPSAVDSRADVYGVGVIAFRMLAGRLPVGDELDPAAYPDVPADLGSVVASAIQPDPGKRPADAAAMLDAIEETIGLPRKGAMV